MFAAKIFLFCVSFIFIQRKVSLTSFLKLHMFSYNVPQIFTIVNSLSYVITFRKYHSKVNEVYNYGYNYLEYDGSEVDYASECQCNDEENANVTVDDSEAII